MAELFLGREDTYGLQGSDGRWYRQSSPVTTAVLRRHLDQEITVGIYPHRPEDSRVRWGCIDLDVRDPDALNDLFVAARVLGVREDAMLREDSGNKGYHLWVFFRDWVEPAPVVRLLRTIHDHSHIPHAVEIFPKQEHLKGQDSFGNLVKLPLGIHRASGRLAEPLVPVLIEPVTEDELARLVLPLPSPTAPPLPVDPILKAAVDQPVRIRDGFRHNTLKTLAASLLGKGVPADGVEAALLAYDRDNCEHPLQAGPGGRSEIQNLAGMFPPNPPTAAILPRLASRQDHDAVVRQMKIRRVSELRQLPDAEVEWVVERFAASGAITDLVAYIKVGKSTLVAQAIADVLHGDDFLERFPTRRSPVVLLTEERPASLLAALDDAGVKDDDDLHIVLWTENGELDWAAVVAQAAETCHQIGARLLVVDTLGIWSGVEDENAATQARTAMGPLMQAASGIAIVVLRQARKSGGEIHNAGRGSGAYGGAADILLHLDYLSKDGTDKPEESPRRWLSIKSRLDRDQVPSMQLIHKNGRYQMVPDLTPVDVPARTKIMADLKANGPSRPTDIAKRTGVERRAVNVTLGRMDGLAIKAGEGRWKITPIGEPLT